MDRRRSLLQLDANLCRLFAASPEALIGRRLDDFLCLPGPGRLARLFRRFLAGRSMERRGRWQLRQLDGSFVPVTATVLKPRSRGGPTVITVRLLTAAATPAITPTIDLQNRWNGLMAALQGGFWEWDLRVGTIRLSPHWKALLGYRDDEIAEGIPAWQQLMVVEDKDLPNGLTDRMADDPSLRYDLVQRFRHKTGRIIWMRSRAVDERDDTGRLIRLVGSSLDVSDRMEAEQAHEFSQAQLASIIDTVHDALLSMTRDLTVTTFNKRAQAVFGWSAGEMVGTLLDRLLPPEWEGNRSALAAMTYPADNGPVSDWQPVRGLHRDGFEVPLLVSIARVSVFGHTAVIATFRDISEEKRIAAELVDLAEEKDRQLRRAEAANHAKSQFLAVMSHELRTPLNAIIGFSEMMEGEYLGPLGTPRYRDYARDIRRSGGHLLALINDVLDLSRIEANALKLTPEVIDLAQEIERLVTVMKPQAREKGLALLQETDASLPPVVADRRAVRQIILNLVSNAVRFTRRNGTIRVAATPSSDGRRLRLEIHDTGIGIPRERLTELGRPFVQIQDAYRTSEGGTGLGLAIVKSLAEAMGTAMQITSEIGRGTSVSVELPVAEAAPPDPALAPGAGQGRIPGLARRSRLG